MNVRLDRHVAPLRPAFTLTDLVATVVCGILLAQVTLKSTDKPKPYIDASTATCADNLRAIGEGAAMCFTENDGYGPTADDGAVVRNMLNWTDVLYDVGYTLSDDLRLCPADAHPDEPTATRGRAWNLVFVDDFQGGQTPQYGVRTAYALNAHVDRNFRQDRFDDVSRQVYAMDGWWSWFGSINAAWVYYEHVTGRPRPNPVNFPQWQGTMVGWRHGAHFSANTLYLDGHVATVTPIVPENIEELWNGTVDSLRTFSWLPGEKNVRYDFDPYAGSLPEYLGRRPYWTDPQPPVKTIGGRDFPVDYPEYLSCVWRTENQVWENFPNDRR